MKNRILLIILIAGFSVTSCYDTFLEQAPQTPLILTEDVFSSEANITALIPGAYQPMRWEFNPDYGDSYCMTYLYTDVRSDDAIIENKYFQPHSHGFEDFVSLTATNINVEGIWAKLFAGVSKANQIIQGLVVVDDAILGSEIKALYLSEARFLRGYYYFELVKNFGDVPLFGDQLADVSDPEQIKRQPVADVYAQIEADLNEAALGLPIAQEEKYRATKGAALALLSKVYLFQEKWQLAADAAQAVIDLGVYELEEEYGDNFKIENEFGKESIFEIEYRYDVSGGNWNKNSQTSLSLQFFAPPFAGTTITGWSYNLTTPELLAAYNDEGDLERRDATIMQEGHVFNSPALASKGFDPIPIGWFDEWINSPTSGGNRYGDDFSYSLKYFLTPEELAASSPSLVESTLNHKVIRYADILLVLAEATLRGATGEGQSAFDEVRERAGLTAKTLTIDALKLERRLELAGEYNRFHDLIRWGNTQTLKDFTPGRDELLPIPVKDILLTGKIGGEYILKQNPGY